MEYDGCGLGGGVVRGGVPSFFVYGFVCFGLLKSERVSKWARNTLPDRAEPSRDRNGGRAEKDEEY